MNRQSNKVLKQLLSIASILLLATLLLAQPGTSPVLADGSISGTVFRDFDADGVLDGNEPGIGGITVTAVSDTGDTGTTTTASDGTYTLPTLVGNDARVEFTLPTNGSLDFLQPGAAGGTTVQFVDISNDVTGLDAGFNNPAQYSVAAPQVVVPRWTRGEPTTAPNNAESVIRGHDYLANSAAAPLTDYATYQQVGTIFGLSHQTQSGVIFGSTYIRRGAAVGPTNTTGTIYKLTGTGAPAAFIDLTAIVSTGANPHPNGVAHDFTADSATYPLVGKIGLGDLEISDDELTLYTVNLNERELVIMPLTFDGTGQPVAPAAGDVDEVAIPVPTDCDDNGSDPNEPDAADWRPFGLKFFDGLLYVGGVCTAESMIDPLDPTTATFAMVQPFLQYLDAHVYVYDPATGFNTTPILSIPLDYSREAVNDGMLSTLNDAEWLPWTNDWRPTWAGRNGSATPIVANPQPLLTDIELDGRGFMYLGFRDRFADQAYDQGDPGPSGAPLTSQRFGGDFLLACLDAGGNWQLESGATLANRGCTNGQTGEARLATNPPSDDANTPDSPLPEFFHADQYLVNGGATASFHDETALGTLAMLYGSGELVATKYDAFEAFENGTITYDIDNGDRIRAVQLFEAGNSTFFRKAGGLGDIELIGGAAPIEVGNRIWSDDDGDGVQDPGEPPIAGVTVSLHDAAGTLLNSAITDANGNYSFSNSQTIGTVVSQVNASSDDAEQRTDTGTVSLISPDTEIGNNNNAAQGHAIGLRFTNLTIPAGATITSAYIQFATDGTITTIGNPAIFTIDGQAADNAPTFAAVANNVTTRPRTSAGVQATWSTATWAGTNFNGPLQRTPNLSAVVQEIVDRVGWASGNAMAFIINNSADHRNAESFDGSANGIFAPVLVVNYSLPNPADYVALQYRTAYELRVDQNQAALNGYSVSPPTADATPFGEIRDSDGQPRLGGYVALPFTTSGPGANDHTYDFGFVPSVSLGDFLWNDEDNDGLYQPPVRVGDFVWYDLDSDGLQDTGEPGVGGLGVELHLSTATDCNATPLLSTTTAPTGLYLFDNLTPGNYFVCFDLATLPANFVVTAQNAGADNIDSDADTGTGRTANTGALATGTQFPDMDMGIVNSGGISVGDKVWYDVNGDGRQDSNEPGTPNVTVNLFTLGQSCADTPVQTDITDGNGRYIFSGLAMGNYFVCFDLTTLPPGYAPTAANTQADDSVDSDADPTGQTPATGPLTAPNQFDFTLDMGIHSSDNVIIGDFVWYDTNVNGQQDAGEGGVSGITVELYAAGDVCGVDPAMMRTTTAADGSYLFAGLPAGSYFVCFDLGTLPAGFVVTTQNAGNDVTDSDADPGTGATQTLVLNPGDSDITLDMGIRQSAAGSVSVGDRVWYDVDRDGVQDPGEAGVAGVGVELHLATDADCNAAPTATTTTDAQGNYLFSGLTAANYFVCFDLTTLPSPDYAVTFQNTGSNGGTDSDADPITGRTGNTGPLVAGEAYMSLDMGIYATTHETRLPGIVVQIYAAAQACDGSNFLAEVTTDASGNYVFPNLTPGQYYLHLPASNFAPGGPLEYMFASTLAEADPNNNVNNNNNGFEVTAGACAGGVSTNPVDLAVATEPLNDGNTDPNTPDISHNLTVDIGVYEPLCIGDQMWYDADDSGLLDGAEYGINGVNLDLYLDVDGDGNFEPGGDDGSPVASTITANVGGRDGSYSFCSVIPGDYFVHVPATEFEAGDLLSLTRSSTAVVDPQTSDAEDDNNGSDGGDAATNGIVVAASVGLNLRVEPTTDRDVNDNGRRDASTNQTVDFGIALDEVMDFGDLPSSYNSTIFGDNGPRHPNTGLLLGTAWDNDNDGQESAATDGDDNDGTDDEDGIDISLTGTWGDGTGDLTATVTGGSGCLIGWADFSNDGGFDDEVNDGVGLVSERLFVQFLAAGTTAVSFPTPLSSAIPDTYNYPAELNMRYRLFQSNDPLFAAMGLTVDGNGCPDAANTTAEMATITTRAAVSGEVEDYQQAFTPTAVRLSNLRATSQTPLLLVVSTVLFLLLVSGLVLVGIKKRVR